jgi:hypothetical protein
MKKSTLCYGFIIDLALFAGGGTQAIAQTYCELDGASTDSGEAVYGECYMYSAEYGELDGARTESGVPVSGECYRYSRDYAELEGAETEYGEGVSGECYFY